MNTNKMIVFSDSPRSFKKLLFITEKEIKENLSPIILVWVKKSSRDKMEELEKRLKETSLSVRLISLKEYKDKKNKIKERFDQEYLLKESPSICGRLMNFFSEDDGIGSPV